MKKTWNIIKKVIVWMIVVLSVGMMAFTIISVTTFDRADRSVFGYSAFIVLSDSMKATDFDAGDLVIIKQTDPSTLKEGDIISFQSPDEANYGEIVTHKIREVTTDEDGNPGFVTYGTTTDSNDQGIVTYNLVIGKYKGHIPNVGTFFQFLKTVPGYFICIFTPFFILILVQARNSIKLFRKYKKEQVEEIQKEKKELEEERLKSQEMMAQLMRMQQQMGQNGGTVSPELMQQYIQQQQQSQPQMPQQAAQPQPGVQQGQGTQQNHQPETRTYANPQASAPQGVQHDANVQRTVQPQTPVQPRVQAELSNVKPQRTAEPQVQMSQQSRTYAQQSQQMHAAGSTGTSTGTAAGTGNSTVHTAGCSTGTGSASDAVRRAVYTAFTPQSDAAAGHESAISADPHGTEHCTAYSAAGTAGCGSCTAGKTAGGTYCAAQQLRHQVDRR